jgi:Domain of unknown function (DUF4468) with TBP-like fold
MKWLLLGLFFITLSGLKAQVFPIVEGKVVYGQIDSVAATKDELFIRAKVWLVNTFKSAKAVIQLDDKEAGKLMGKGVDTYSFKYGINYMDISGGIYYTIQIDCKDNKARIRIFNIEQGNTEGVSLPIETSEYWPKKSKPKVEAIVNHQAKVYH